jgi:hypothetical protein
MELRPNVVDAELDEANGRAVVPQLPRRRPDIAQVVDRLCQHSVSAFQAEPDAYLGRELVDFGGSFWPHQIKPVDSQLGFVCLIYFG